MVLLEAQHAVLDAALRRAMVQALILLRNRNQVWQSGSMPAVVSNLAWCQMLLSQICPRSTARLCAAVFDAYSCVDSVIPSIKHYCLTHGM